ncbi:MAG: DUF3150 domain-containing protein [Verrucomicrobia bacterium]|nr:DUF3150 domain-containing protein [Verrucomicrobiota bacterium]
MNHNSLLDVLTHEGVLVSASIRYWRATTKLKPEDLGLDPDKVTQRLISLGHKKLLSKEALEPFTLIESRTHALIEASTFPFLKGLSRFLPNAKLQETLDRINQLAGEFTLAKSDFLGRYAEMRLNAVEEWRETARRLVADPDRLVATIEAAFPEHLENRFSFNTQFYQIKAPEGLDLRLIEAGEQRAIIAARDEAARLAAERIHYDVERFVGECVSSLREETAKLCEEMLESMHSGKTGVHQKTLNRLIRFIDEFKKLNFVGDQQMEAELERVRQEFLVRTAEEYRENRPACQRLQEGLQGLASMARKLAQNESRELVDRFGQMGQRKFHLAA